MPDNLKTIKVTYTDGTAAVYPKGITLLEISREIQPKYPAPIVAAKVGQELKDLSYALEQDSQVMFLDLTTQVGARLYRNSLNFVLFRAAAELFPGCQVTIEHSLNNGLYGEFKHRHPLNEKDLRAIEKRMRQIVAEDVPFERKSMPKQAAMELFAREGYPDKAELLAYVEKNTVNVYRCGPLYDYFYDYLVPSTGYLQTFQLRLYLPGFILQYPEPNAPFSIPPYVEQHKLANIFRESEQWADILHVGNVAALNQAVAKGEINDIILVAEALHEKKIAQIADLISNSHNAGIILIAGPSSSGKTTFAQRLLIQLRVNGLKPISISLDDYFVNRDKTPLDAEGNPDFESIEAIDLPLFNEHLIRLIQGEEVELPSYNFHTGHRESSGRRVTIAKNQPLIIEGIHGLNERLTASIPKHHKFKIYVSALTQLNIDSHNRIPTTDARVIRRIVRDNQFRSHDARMTLAQWPSVRRGEEKNIFPFQEEADVMFNSALVYELSVLRKYAEPLLRQVPKTEPEYAEAQRLLDFLSHFLPANDEIIPRNSILREFIGHSCFQVE